MSQRSKYHHGDLRAALIDAAVEIITEAGIEGFSLRASARRAGVAPSAPAHHFGSAKGLLTEVAVEAYRRMGVYLSDAAPDGGSAADLPEISQAYVKFALENPGLFRLMFRNDLVDRSNDDYRQTSVSAMLPLALAAEDHCKATGRSGPEGIFAIWSAIHGAAHLVLEEKAHLLFGLSSNDELVKSHLLRIMASISGR